MTWNVWWRFGGNWRERERRMVSTLRDLGPDVVGLQEVWGTGDLTQADVIADALAMHAAFAAPSLEPSYADDHLAQTRRLAELVADPSLDGPLPVLLAADLNAAPDAPEMRPLLDVMVDTWTAGGGDPRGRTLRSEHPFAPLEAVKQIDQRIDYVLARPGTGRTIVARHAFTVGDPVDGLHPSDHDAVVVDLVLDEVATG